MAKIIQAELGQLNQNFFRKQPDPASMPKFLFFFFFLEACFEGGEIYPNLLIITSFRKEFVTHIHFKHTISITLGLKTTLRCLVHQEEMSFTCRDDYFLHLMHDHPFNLYRLLEIALQGRVGKTPVF